MKIFPPEPKIDIGKDGFDGIDKLGRKDFGAKLSGLLSVVEEPIVVAIDGGWGSGKTVFLKCWVGEHMMRAENTDQVSYFDAFANDFLDDPLISLISTLSSISTESSKSKIDKLKETAVALAGPAFRIALAAASTGVSEVAGAIAGAVSTATTDEAVQAAEKFWKREDGRQAAMEQFGILLGELAATGKGAENKPGKLIFVIDELDRCRPDYALALLETIKHFFAVENVHFVLGVNLSELKNMVKVRYGLDTADAYLQKFIHLNMSLPALAGPRPEYTAGLVHFKNITEEMEIPSSSCENIQKYLTLRAMPPSLRDVERLSTYLALLATALEQKIYGYNILVLGAAVLKSLEPGVYRKLLADEAPFQTVADALSLSTSLDSQSSNFRFSSQTYYVWAGFMDASVWNSDKNEYKEYHHSFFGLGVTVPSENNTPVSGIISNYLETFQTTGHQ